MSAKSVNDRIRDGNAADRLLRDEIFLHSSKRLTLQWAADWAAEESPDARERLWYKQKALAEIREDLRSLVQDGVAAEAEREGEARLGSPSGENAG